MRFLHPQVFVIVYNIVTIVFTIVYIIVPMVFTIIYNIYTMVFVIVKIKWTINKITALYSPGKTKSIGAFSGTDTCVAVQSWPVKYGEVGESGGSIKGLSKREKMCFKAREEFITR